MPKYAIYSEKQLHSCDGMTEKQPVLFEYEKPDGSLVFATEVGETRLCPNSSWDDKIDLGEVSKFIRIVKYSV